MMVTETLMSFCELELQVNFSLFLTHFCTFC